MPLFHHVANKDTGNYTMVEVEETYTGRKFETAAPGATISTGKVYSCQVAGCDKRFKSAGVAAQHFRRHHPELNEDKFTWKAHFEVT